MREGDALTCAHSQRQRASLSLTHTRMELASSSWSCSTVLVALMVVSAAPLLYHLWVAFVGMCWRPLRIKRAFEAQGITTLPFHFISGNLREIVAMGLEAFSRPMPQVSHDIAPRILPHFYHWAQEYGTPYVYWLGSQTHYNVMDVEHAKDILSAKYGQYRKLDYRPDIKCLLGDGLVLLEGERWAQHRSVINPVFFPDKLKAMIPTMRACTTVMMDNWDTLIEAGQAIDVHKDLKDLTADIIAHTAFGSSFAEGKQVFELQRQQQDLVNKILATVYIPGARFLPTAFNRHLWKIDRDIKRGLHQIVQLRKESISKVGHGDSYGNDLLGIMMDANKQEFRGNQKNVNMNMGDIIDECKTFFFTGHETTSNLLTWTFLLLAINPEWQTRTREEVLAVCGMTDIPTADALNLLKIMGMVLNESLRLYPPGAIVSRKACTDKQLGKVVIPKGTVLTMPIISWHHDERYWGEDVNEFRPERFSEGVSKASRVAGAFMPFSMGPYMCIGQNFAMLEAKVVLATILQRYRFRLSPTYQHAPITVLTLQPQFGMPILFEKL